MNFCTIDGCDQVHQARGYCTKHYTRLLRYGDPLVVRKPRGKAAEFFEQLLTSRAKDCIPWPFTVSGSDQRPWIMRKGRRGYVARFLCEETQGLPSSETHQAAHLCGDKSCVNPNHLYWATPMQNQADRIKHGTAPRGENQGSHKLTEAAVREIRSLEGIESAKALSLRYPVEPKQIRRIWRRERWGWLD